MTKKTNNVGSAALELMNYDENFGELIKTFFNKLGTATSACIGVDEE